jgi:hypothetical protein
MARLRPVWPLSGGQALGSGASKGQQSIDDRGLAPLRSPMASPYLYSTRIAEQILRQGTPMASGDGQLCETPAAQGLPRAAQSIPELTVTEHFSCHEAHPSGWSQGVTARMATLRLRVDFPLREIEPVGHSSCGACGCTQSWRGQRGSYCALAVWIFIGVEARAEELQQQWPG